MRKNTASESAASGHAASISDQDKQFLAAYGKAHDALVADDPDGAKKQRPI